MQSQARDEWSPSFLSEPFHTPGPRIQLRAGKSLIFQNKTETFCSFVKYSHVLEMILNSLKVALMSLVWRFY